MTPVGIIFRRTISRAFFSVGTAVAMAVFVAAFGAIFTISLLNSEGVAIALPVIFAESVSWVLPFIVAYFAMDELSGERLSGRLELLFSAPIRERDIVLGKFAGVLAIVVLAVVMLFVSAMFSLKMYAPQALAQVLLTDFVPGFIALMVHGTLWTAVSLAFSSMLKSGAVAGIASLVTTVAIPRGGWFALMKLSSEGSVAFGEMPLDAQIADMSSGLFSLAMLVSFAIITLFVLFLTSKRMLLLRIGGCGGGTLKLTTITAIALSAVAAALAVMLAFRLDARLEVQVSSARMVFSSRTRSVLSDTQGDVAVDVFLSRKDPRFRSVCSFLRSLADESAALGGARFRFAYVDPKWDIGAAERLVRDGAVEGSVIFTRGHRSVAVPLTDGFSERTFASAIHRLTTPPTRRAVCWSVGHGEYAYNDYGAWGMSDIARELVRYGYENRKLDLSDSGETIGSDCALIIIAGAKKDFSRSEVERIDGYLRKGGRLLLLQNVGDATALASLLPGWGLRTIAFPMVRTRTLSGSDIIVDEFAEHQASSSVAGLRIVLERPVAYASSAAAESGVGADKIEYTALASVGGVAVAAAVERGAGLGKDLSLRPTRIVCIGDGTFAVNGFLASRANANRDFFLSCVSYLSGTEVACGDGRDAGVFVSGLDRRGAWKLAQVSSIRIPVIIGLLFFGLIIIRRRS